MQPSPLSTVRSTIDPASFDAGVLDHPAYAQALAHLYGRLNTEALDPATFATVERNLDEFGAFLARLDNPHLGRPTVHATGTRGKGSTLAMLEGILRQSGKRTGLTVSPHLMEVRERIRIDGTDLTRDQFAHLYAILRPVADEMMNGVNFRTVFELLTTLAFVAFRELQVDVDLVEVGMGGKLDATNVVQPVLSLVTRIGLDHTQVLGDTVEAIAADKGMIIKPNSGAILSRQTGRALDVLERRCLDVEVVPWRLDHEIRVEDVRPSQTGTTFTVHTPLRSHRDLVTPLLGRHQAENGAIAAAAADRLMADGVFTVSEEHVRSGLTETRWPGRAERLADSPTVLIDGAHTDQGATALDQLLRDVYGDRRLTLVLGMNRDKDAHRFLNALSVKPHRVITTRADSPRAMEADALSEVVAQRGWPSEPTALLDTWRVALNGANPSDIILATGSFYVIGALRNLWLRTEDPVSTFRS